MVAALKKIAEAGRGSSPAATSRAPTRSSWRLWKEAGVTPAAPWYIESGQGMGATLGIANDRQAYTITDRATLLAFSQARGAQADGRGGQARC